MAFAGDFLHKKCAQNVHYFVSNFDTFSVKSARPSGFAKREGLADFWFLFVFFKFINFSFFFRFFKSAKL